MGNPVITRLGINQFWYKHWYSDTRYHQTIKEDATFTTFIEFYLNHGIIRKSNPFIHEYWYRRVSKKIRVHDQEYQNLQAFRRYYYTNERLGIEHSYFIRHRTGEYFPMRLWIMRYGEWLFLSAHWFKPLKSKSRFRKRAKKKFTGAIYRATTQTTSARRLNLVKHFVESASYGNRTYSF